MAMRTRKIYIIVEIGTNRILHSTNDLNESMEKFKKLQKSRKDITTECRYQ